MAVEVNWQGVNGLGGLTGVERGGGLAGGKGGGG